jgi:tetratricopeptide (TPR) repeat protein
MDWESSFFWLNEAKVFIAIAAAIISVFASVSSAQPKASLPTTQQLKPLPALSEEQIKSLIQAETEKKDALRGQAEAERKFDTTMVWVQVLLGGVSLLLTFVTIVPVSLGVLFWIFRRSIFGQLNAEATEEVKKQVEDHLKPIIDTEVQAQISILIEKKLKPLLQEFESTVPASTEVVPSLEKRNKIDKLRRRIEDLQDLIPAAVQSAKYYFKQGNAFYFDKQYEEALDSYNKAIEINPDYVPAWHNRGRPLSRLKRYKEAFDSYNKAIEINSDYFLSWYNRGIVLRKLGRYEEAFDSYNKAVEINPNYVSAWYNRGIVLRKLGRYEEAINSYSKAIEINPDYVSAWYNIACYYALQANIEKTVSNLKKTIEIDSKYREKAKTDSDFDTVRQDERFQELLKDEH